MTSRTVYAFSLPQQTDPLILFSAFRRFPYSLFFDAAAPGHPRSRYSTIAFHPVETIEAGADGRVTITNRDQQLSLKGDPLDLLMQRIGLRFDQIMPDPTLPPFQGGAAGYFGAAGPGAIPPMAFGLYDQIVSFDHAEKAAWHIVLAENSEAARLKHAHFQRLAGHPDPVREDAFQPETSWTPSLTEESFTEAARQAIDDIRAGSCLFRHLAQSFSADVPAGFDDFLQYLRLRRAFPSPFGAFLNLGGTTISSLSPGPMISIRNRKAETMIIRDRVFREPGAVRDEALRHAISSGGDETVREAARKLERIADGIAVDPPVLESTGAEHLMVSALHGTLRKNANMTNVLHAILSSAGTVPVTGTIGFQGNLDLALPDRTIVSDGKTLHFCSGIDITERTSPVLAWNRVMERARRVTDLYGSGEEKRWMQS